MKKKKKIVKRLIFLMFVTVVLFLNRDNLINFTGEMLSDINFKLVETKTLIYDKYTKYNEKLNYLNNVQKNIEELEKLKSEIQLLSAEKMELEKFEKENTELRSYLKLENNSNRKFITAEVILKDDLNEQDIIFINKGSKDGIEPNLPVILNSNVIGRINKVSEDYSEVYLISNPNFKMSVNVNGIFTGIIRGKGSLNFVIKNFNVEKADKISKFDIETSGISEMYPKRLPIGTFDLQDKSKLMDSKELNFSISDKVIGINTVVVYKFNASKLKLLKKIEGNEVK
ncbi:rod shape-determining protein MreC [Streptobacillus moniliformis]|uniref:rod shape-determining protein MreC n=1 Tax=Streptobacillus moniliformis TaxID=34105 RepID=UPI0007E38AE3|nr:rod shape-determining protein MreC [Streptobacillus moniliformis]